MKKWKIEIECNFMKCCFDCVLLTFLHQRPLLANMHVPTCFATTPACFSTNLPDSYACQRALRAKVPTCFACQHAKMPTCQHTLLANLPMRQCDLYAKYGKGNTTELRYMLQHYRKRITTAILLIFSKYIWTNKNFYVRNLLTTKYTQSLSCKAFFTFLM